MPAFREDQLPRACRAICAAARLDSFWLSSGPADRADAALRGKGGTLARTRYAALRAAWSLWNGRGDLSLADAVQECDAATLQVIGGGLLTALAGGGACLDAFLNRCEQLPPVLPFASASTPQTAPPSAPMSPATPLASEDDDGYGDRDDRHASGAWRRAS